MPTFLIDMDSITVDMTKVWLEKYNDKTGEKLSEDKLDVWNWDGIVKYPEKFNEILTEENFFFNLKPIPDAIEYATKFMEMGVDFIFLTQPPRKSDWAVRDKRRWINKYFPKYDLKNACFFHRKERVIGDLLFDDSPEHLFNWNKMMTVYNIPHIAATIDYSYNREIKADWRFNKETAWKNLYERSCDYFNLNI